jgi:hypothetical protein
VSWLELLAPLSITGALLVIGLLSRRLGRATRAAPYYIGFFVAALLVGSSVLARLVNLILRIADANRLQQDTLWVLLYHGLPALGVTLGVVFAWRYWSWLLAERD